MVVVLPPPERPTSAVVWPGSATRLNLVQHEFARAIEEVDIVELHPAFGDLQLRLVAALLFRRRLVQEFVEHADAHQRRGQVDMQARHALGRFGGQQQSADEGEEIARRLAAIDHAIAAINHDQGDRETGERLHQRAGARLDARQLVGGALELLDARHLPIEHKGLQRKGLDHANALRRLLQGFEMRRSHRIRSS